MTWDESCDEDDFPDSSENPCPDAFGSQHFSAEYNAKMLGHESDFAEMLKRKQFGKSRGTMRTGKIRGMKSTRRDIFEAVKIGCESTGY